MLLERWLSEAQAAEEPRRRRRCKIAHGPSPVLTWVAAVVVTAAATGLES
jgi:hypothetical protein